MIPNIPQAIIKDAIKEKKIIAAEKVPNREKKPIGDREITRNPRISDAAEPINATPDAPPTAMMLARTVSPLYLSSLNLSIT